MMNDADTHHWRTIALWLATLSLIPTAVVIYATTAKPDDAPQWWTMIETATAAACVLAALWAHTAAIKSLNRANAKQWARHAGFAFMATALCMSAVGIARMTAAFLTTIP